MLIDCPSLIKISDIFPSNSKSILDPNFIIPKYSPAITSSGVFFEDTILLGKNPAI